MASYDLGNARISLFTPGASVWTAPRPSGYPRYGFGARVRIEPLGLTARTDDTGAFAVPELPAAR